MFITLCISTMSSTNEATVKQLSYSCPYRTISKENGYPNLDLEPAQPSNLTFVVFNTVTLTQLCEEHRPT